MEDMLDQWRNPKTQPSTAKMIRERLGILASKMDAELEPAIDDLVQWWRDARPTRNIGCYKPAASEELDPSPQLSELAQACQQFFLR